MGRIKKYLTKEEREEANRRYVKKYYWKNKKRIDKAIKEKYRSKKNGKNLHVKSSPNK
jgi:hypothetical protein